MASCGVPELSRGLSIQPPCLAWRVRVSRFARNTFARPVVVLAFSRASARGVRMPPPSSHRARSNAGAAPARASDDALSSPSSPSRTSAPGTPTLSGGLEFDPGNAFLPDLPLLEDADAVVSPAGAREAGSGSGPRELRDSLGGEISRAGERSCGDTETRREGAGLRASIPLARAERVSASSNSIFSNGPRSTPYDAAIPCHSPPGLSSPETPTSPTSPTRGGPPSGPPSSSGPPSVNSREASASGTEARSAPPSLRISVSPHAAGSSRRRRDGARKEEERGSKAAVKEVKDVKHAPGDGKDSLRRLFKLPETEVFVEEYLCALYKKILLQGRMYVFENHVCFYSNVFGYTKVKTIALKDVTIVNRAYTAQVVFNAIEIVHKGKCEFFTSFIFPDRTYKTITRAWRACSRYAKIFADQKTLSGAHDAERSGDGGGVSDEARSSPEVRAMLGEVDPRRPRTTLTDETDGPGSAGSLSASRDVERDEDAEASSKRDEDASLDARVPAFKAATVAGGVHGRRASAPALRLASSPVLAAASAGGEELDEPSAPPSGPLSADESEEDLPDEASFRVGLGSVSTGADPFLDEDALDALPPLPARPADHATLVESFVVECSVARFFALAWSDAAGESFTPACAEARKHRELRVTPWRAHRGYGHARDLTFVAPTNASIGPRETHCHQTQSYRVYKTNDKTDDALPGVALVVDTSQVQKDIPYGDYFRVESRWEVRPAPPRLLPDGETVLNERCEVWVGLRIPFQKTTMLRKVIEKSALEESRQSAQGVLTLVDRRLAERELDSSAVTSPATRPRHRRQHSFADAVAETVDVSKLLIPEGSRDVIWRMLFGSKERSPKKDASAKLHAGVGKKKHESSSFVRDPSPEAGGGSEPDAPDARARKSRSARFSRNTRARFSSAPRAVGESPRKTDSEDDAMTHDAALGARGVDLVATCLARLATTARVVLASLLLRKILAAALIAWLAARAGGGDEPEVFSAAGRFLSSAAESLFSARDSAVADVARWKRRAASLELELQALERRAAFVAGEAAHARAALAEAIDRTTSEQRSAVRGGIFSALRGAAEVGAYR